MEAQLFNNLISYASELGLIENLINDEDKLTFNLNGASYCYDPSNDNISILKVLREAMPVTEIIDLVNEAIKLGIVTDISKDYSNYEIMDYDGNYLDIIDKPCYYFKINSESFDDTIYKITFNKDYHDIKKKIEYASRTSLFVDTLIKRIMAKYNILLVRKASWENHELPKLPLDSNAISELGDISDSSFETDVIENQLKVLINYRDNFNNTTCNENVIDDIFINLKNNEVNYGFVNIGQSDELDPLYDVINDDVSADDIDSLLRIRNLINDSLVKFNIFETLRNNPNTNLSKLIDSRIEEYDERINTDPKIEFTITPLSIYCNHIVEKTATFEIRSTNKLYEEYSVSYNVTYNPANAANAKFNIYADGELELLKQDDLLVIAFDDVKGEKELNPKITSKEYATMLYGISNRYNKNLYKDVYFLNDSLVKLIDGNLVPYDGNPDINTYLKSQIVKGEISGKYIYIGNAMEIAPNDILGVDLLDIDTKRYVSKEYVRKCDLCGHIYGATKEVWELYKESHKVVNEIDKKSCCDSCKGTILENGNAVIYSAGYKKYYLDNPENLKYTDVCILCENPEEAFIYVNPINKSRGRCKICNRYYCGKHLDLEKNICNNCNQINVKNDNIDSKLLRQIKKNIDPIDALSKNLSFNYMKDDNAVWVYSKRKDKTIIYYLVIDEDEKFVHLMGRNVKRGDE
ncbi:MAG: hypothetical protein K6F81_02305 [Acholeplasmatales bacterium]|nr:hypothetical protein [Acholeplasmatales bacterium]